ncbi:MAG: hypothetical protein IKE30_06545 [Clostridia bacterium]|nr:hypothetical protein [Clostridia bacterium]
MLYLVLAVLSSALVAIVMRAGTAGGESRKPMLLVNYAVCAGVSLFFLRGRPAGQGFGVALGLGLIGGALYLTAFLLFQYNVRTGGVTLSSAFMKLGVIVPTLLGISLFGESAGPARLAGIALTVLAILMMARHGEASSANGRAGQNAANLPALILLLICGGMADGLSKFYAAWGNPALEGYFLCFVFCFALVLCAVVCAIQKQLPTRRDFVFGLLLGIPNYFSSRFLLLSLSSVPASVAYPLFSCGAILLSAALGRLCFSERISRRQAVSLIPVLFALVLLNL